MAAMWQVWYTSQNQVWGVEAGGAWGLMNEKGSESGSLLGQMLAQKNTGWACDLKQTAGEEFVFSHQSRDTIGGLGTQ